MWLMTDRDAQHRHCGDIEGSLDGAAPENNPDTFTDFTPPTHTSSTLFKTLPTQKEASYITISDEYMSGFIVSLYTTPKKKFKILEALGDLYWLPLDRAR